MRPRAETGCCAIGERASVRGLPTAGGVRGLNRGTAGGAGETEASGPGRVRGLNRGTAGGAGETGAASGPVGGPCALGFRLC